MAGGQAVQGGYQGGRGRDQPDQVGAGGGGVKIPQRLELAGRAKPGDGRAQRGHGTGRPAHAGDGRQRLQQHWGKPTGLANLGREALARPGLAGEGAVEEELPHLLQAAMASQLHGRVLAVMVEALQTAYVTDFGVGDGQPFEAGWDGERGRRCCRHVINLDTSPHIDQY